MAVYGAPPYVPLDERCPATPLNSYGASKLSIEKYVAIFGKSRKIPAACLRYSSVFGPGNRSTRAVPTFIKRALRDEALAISGDGNTVRDYLFVADAVEAALSAIAREKSGVFNIGSGRSTKVIDLARVIVSLAGSESSIEIREAPKDFDFVYDISRAEKELEFSPRTPLREGLKKEIEWHRVSGFV
jgi:UDP-glucose 4-epimerase